MVTFSARVCNMVPLSFQSTLNDSRLPSINEASAVSDSVRGLKISGRKLVIKCLAMTGRSLYLKDPSNDTSARLLCRVSDLPFSSDSTARAIWFTLVAP